MHPIVNDFIFTNDRLASIVEKHYNKDQPLESFFLRLVRAFTVNNLDDQFYTDLEQAILYGHADPDLYIFFISYSVTFTCNRNQIERATAIQSIGSTIAVENFHPILRAYYTISLAILRYHQGKFEECDRLLKELTSKIDKTLPRYVTILGNIASLISKQGRLKELDKEDLELLNSQSDEHRAIACLDVKLANCIFTGNYKEGFSVIEEYKKKIAEKKPFVFQEQINFLKIISGDFDQNNYEQKEFKLYARTCHALSQGNMEEARRIYQVIQKEGPQKLPGTQIHNYVPLHIELSLKNKGKARLLLQEIIGNGSNDYMNDFFLARLQLLEMNLEGAAESFGRLMANVKRYEAMNRVHFELKFAKEIQASDIFMLTNGIVDTKKSDTPVNKKQKPVSAVQPEKGIKLLIGDSQEILNVKKLVIKFGNLKEPVLITGETGSGKELVSRAIHEEGLNANEPFLAINCGAFSESLLESELFGYEAGAFTGAQKERKGIFESAGKGTVFLDEFGDISSKMQVSLLRVLESNEIRLIGGTKTRQVECKIVIATNIDLRKAVEEKRFREDLYFRLNRFDIKLPSLRERVEDIPKLVDYFLKDTKGNLKVVTKSLLDALMYYRWPGNIRELKNEMERLKILHSDKEVLDLPDFDFTHLQEFNAPASVRKEDAKNKTLPSPNKTPSNNNERVISIINRGSKAKQRQDFLKDMFREHKRLKKIQVMEIASISAVTAAKDLDALCELGFIEKKSPTKSLKSNYFEIIE